MIFKKNERFLVVFDVLDDGEDQAFFKVDAEGKLVRTVRLSAKLCFFIAA